MLVENFDGTIKDSEEGKLFWMSYDELRKAPFVPIVAKLVTKLKNMKVI